MTTAPLSPERLAEIERLCAEWPFRIGEPRAAVDAYRAIPELLAEVRRLTAIVAVSPDDIRAVADENERLRQAFDQAIRSLSTGGSVHSAFCSWCDQRWPMLDGESHEVARKYANDHAQTCPAHPLRIERDRLAAEVRRLREELGHATAHEGDWLSKTSRAMCETLLGDRDALREKVKGLTADVSRLTALCDESAKSYCRALDRARERYDGLVASDATVREDFAKARQRIAALESGLRGACDELDDAGGCGGTIMKLRALADGVQSSKETT